MEKEKMSFSESVEYFFECLSPLFTRSAWRCSRKEPDRENYRKFPDRFPLSSWRKSDW